MKPWSEFRKFQNEPTRSDDFYGVVDKDGCWVDSARDFGLACYWAMLDAGFQHKDSIAESIQWFDCEGVNLGYSIIHGSMLRKMYEAGFEIY